MRNMKMIGDAAIGTALLPLQCKIADFIGVKSAEY